MNEFNKTQKIEILNKEDIVVFEPSKIVNIPSSAIHIENDISLIQKKLWFEMVYFAFPKMGTQRRYTIPLNRLRELLGWSESTSSDDRLKEALHGLNQTAIKWNIFGKDKKRVWESFPMLSGCRIPEHSGICIFEFSSFLEERFLAMGEEAYVKIDLIISKKFQSKYALSIYCLALDFLILEMGYSEKRFTLEELRRYLALKESEYKLTADFSKRIIKPAEEEINKTSDMNIEIKPLKEGKKIVGYKLCMSLKQGRAREYLERKNKLRQLANTNPNPAEETPQKQKIQKEIIQIQDENLRKFFAKYNISFTTDTFQEKLKETQEIFGADKLENYLLFLIKYAEKEYNKGTIKNFAGFFVSLLKDNTQIDNYLFELEEEKKKQEQKRKFISMRLEEKLKDKYDFSIKQELIERIQNNYSKYENIFTDTILNKINKNSAFYEFNFIRRNNGVVTQEILKSPFLAKEIFEFKELFDYIPMSYENWKKSLPQAYFDNLLKELENN